MIKICGIIGYAGKNNGLKIVLEGLKSLEYRGYDSWGIACKNNPSINMYKKVGKISEAKLEDIVNEGKLKESRYVIGHTRWATHGNVSETNAHPHQSCDENIAVVHNGIIDNYLELKNFLQKEGYLFKSQTDTEVIPVLIQYCMNDGKNFEDAFKEAVKKLEGSYAIAAFHKNCEAIFFAKKGPPLIIGIKENPEGKEHFIASDIPAFLEHTNKVIYIEDDEYGRINKELVVKNIHTDAVAEKKILEVQWSKEDAKKGNYPHFMLKEIYEQEQSIPNAVKNHSALEKAVKLVQNASNVFLAGCGTSHHACIAASYFLAEKAGKNSQAFIASEYKKYASLIKEGDLIVAYSQSGETADLIEFLKHAKQKNAKIAGIVNAIGSTIARMSDAVVPINCGPEICVVSTKAYTAQLAISWYIANALAGNEKEAREMIENTGKSLRSLIEKNEKVIKEIARQTYKSNDYFIIGRDLNYALALESALKIKEISYIHAEGFAGGELKHGPLALIEKGVPVVSLVSEDTRKDIYSNAMEIKSRGGLIIGFDDKKENIYDYHVEVPDNFLLKMIPLQLLSYHLALERGCDVDHPRNLAKSCTVK